MFHTGHTRAVLLVWRYAIKFPKTTSSWAFVSGMLNNIIEWERWEANRHPQLARMYWRAPLGLLLIAKRYPEITQRLTDDEVKALPFSGIDNKRANFGTDGDLIILLDYANMMFCVKDAD